MVTVPSESQSQSGISHLRLLLYDTPYEAHHRLHLSLSHAYASLRSQGHLQPPFSLSIPPPSHYALLMRALAFALLTQPHPQFPQHLKHLHASVTDGYHLFTATLLSLVDASYPKLLPLPKSHLLLLSSELIKVHASNIDSLLISLLRRINTGDFTHPNLWLCAELLNILSDNWEWLMLMDQQLLLSSALFVYLRLLADHYRLPSAPPHLDQLKKSEVAFCIRVLRDCFPSCFPIGRDLLRLLQDLFLIPEFNQFWKHLISEPQKFGISDLCDIYRVKTPSHYFVLRINQEMESHLRFLLSHVKWGNQKRYQAWFATKYLSSPPSETLIVDLIRFICRCHHPTKESIQSGVIARWALIGWLLKSCKKNYFEANAKLALFYDWLFFNESVDNIMDIEPAMLLIVSSVPQYMEITHCLLEFLFLLIDNYDVQRKGFVAKGVLAAFNILVKRGVVHSMEFLTNCQKLSPFLRDKLSTFLLEKPFISQEKESVQR